MSLARGSVAIDVGAGAGVIVVASALVIGSYDTTGRYVSLTSGLRRLIAAPVDTATEPLTPLLTYRSG